jgi:hypothetical protein
VLLSPASPYSASSPPVIMKIIPIGIRISMFARL